MGLIRAEIDLANAREPALASMSVSALVDSSALHLCIPSDVANQLKLEKLGERAVMLADGREETVDYVGPVQITFSGRKCLTGALVLGDEALLGAIPMEDMDLVIHPARLTLTINPNSPNIPMSTAKGLRR